MVGPSCGTSRWQNFIQMKAGSFVPPEESGECWHACLCGLGAEYCAQSTGTNSPLSLSQCGHTGLREGQHNLFIRCKGLSRDFLPSRRDKTQAWANLCNLLQEAAAENRRSQGQSLNPPHYCLLFYTIPGTCPTMFWTVPAQGNKNPTHKNPTKINIFL